MIAIAILLIIAILEITIPQNFKLQQSRGDLLIVNHRAIFKNTETNIIVIKYFVYIFEYHDINKVI